MTGQKIKAHKITKPIQLLAAWLVGLSVTNASFLVAAAKINEPPWIPALLVIASVLNVPVFIVSLFLLQTRFRPEMQEDSYYSKYLEQKYDSGRQASESDENKAKRIDSLAENVIKLSTSQTDNVKTKIVELIKLDKINDHYEEFKGSRTLSELYLNENKWKETVNEWCENPSFIEDIQALVQAGLVVVDPQGAWITAKLSAIGLKIAKDADLKKQLWHQNNND